MRILIIKSENNFFLLKDCPMKGDFLYCPNELRLVYKTDARFSTALMHMLIKSGPMCEHYVKE